ncbi:glycosyltransferase family 10 domain-containing protein [Alteromonas sp. A079]|uniref:glycosyltransferase family 10 domain-containing protein n=1 Tax=Alteromonas sp. A079 TaxID=3410268 RepID=UPI003BA1AFF4
MHKKISIYIFGQFIKRIPFSYASYSPYFSQFFEVVDQPEKADFLVCGFFGDIKTSSELIAAAKGKNKSVQIVVLSEEPLWDTLWYYRWERPIHDVIVEVDGRTQKWPFHFVNHANSDIFDFHQLPYFITTENSYTQRYCQLIKLSSSLSSKEILKRWQRAKSRYSFIAEKRLRDAYHKEDHNSQLLGLSVYRTKVAMEVQQQCTSTRCIGKGWESENARQSLADWHLNKIVTLLDDNFVVSAIENTVVDNYISEKPFDAISLGALPVYWANDSHRIHEFISSDSMINISGLDFRDAARFILDFKPTISNVEALIQTRESFLERITAKNVLTEERCLVAAKTYLHFLNLPHL